MNVTSRNPSVIYKGKTLEHINAIIPRIGASDSFYGTAVVRQFEMMGTYSINRSQAIIRARDKLRSMQILARKGVGMPITGCAHDSRDTDNLIKIAGGPPLIIKLIEGSQGKGVVLTETKNAAQSVIEAFRGLDANILVQEYIGESKGTDLRCIVIGDKVVASMERRAPEGEFRSNIHQGGLGCAVKVTPEERSTAVRATQAMGLKFAGVDIVRSENGPLVLEVNSSPGLQAIEKATKVDVAGKLLDYIEKNYWKGVSKTTSTT